MSITPTTSDGYDPATDNYYELIDIDLATSSQVIAILQRPHLHSSRIHQVLVNWYSCTGKLVNWNGRGREKYWLWPKILEILISRSAANLWWNIGHASHILRFLSKVIQIHSQVPVRDDRHSISCEKWIPAVPTFLVVIGMEPWTELFFSSGHFNFHTAVFWRATTFSFRIGVESFSVFFPISWHENYTEYDAALTWQVLLAFSFWEDPLTHTAGVEIRLFLIYDIFVSARTDGYFSN